MSNENSKLEYESGVTPYAMGILADSGDRKTYNSSALLFSESSGNSPVVRANGVLTGGLGSIPVSGSNNKVDCAAMSLNLAGVIASVSAGLDLTIVRASTNVASISSVTVNSSGVLTVIKGTDSADATFSEVRGGAGGPPFIPLTSVEIFQVRTTTNAAGVITAGEIFQVEGTHFETAGFPTFNTDNFSAQVVFDGTLPASHTGGVAKQVYASYADPTFTEQNHSNDFVPASNSHSVSSEQVYGGTIGSSSSSLGQGSFTAILKDGITDGILGKQNETLFVRYFQDATKAAHILTQGKLGVARTFGASDNPKATMTISSSTESVNRVS